MKAFKIKKNICSITFKEVFGFAQTNFYQNKIKKNPNFSSIKMRFYSFEAPEIGKKSLNNIVKLELLQNKKPEEVEEIWTEFHKKNFPRDIVAAVIKRGIFKKLKQRANEK